MAGSRTVIYLFRHGRTALNAAGLLRGRIDEPLDETGRQEAARLGVFFASVPLDAAVSSPLQRSLDTARAIATPHGLKVISDPSFFDRDYGIWAGKRLQDVEHRYGSLDAAPTSEIEPRAAFERRVITALESLVARSEGKVVAVVGHDAVNRALIRSFCASWRDSANVPQPTGCWNRFVFESGHVLCDIIGALPGNGTRPD